MLDQQEHRLRDDIESTHHAVHHGSRTELPAAIVGGVWAAVFLVLFGVFAVAGIVAAVTAVTWLLWRLRPPSDVRATASG